VHLLSKEYLLIGPIISSYWIIVVPEKIDVIRGWPAPRNVIEVKSFIGLAGYYQRFIKGFLKIASPTTSLQNKGGKFDWNPKCEESLQ
jgi:hypothetical protein